MDSVLSEYQASLADLTFNSKPHINMLTVLAEENVIYASDIVKIIERQIFQVNQKRKMPVLYLLDSIVKNFGGQYMKLFSHKLVTVFMCIFEKADGKTRGDLYKLRSTWDTIFPSYLLKDLDLTVQRVDHNWPMRAKKRHRSRNPNPLSLGHNSTTSPKFSDDESNVKYREESNDQEVEELIEEEEIEMDDESLGVLEMLEEKLRKRQAELSRLEYLESKETDNKVPTFKSPKVQETTQADSDDNNEDGLKIDLNDYPVIPMEDVQVHLPEDVDEINGMKKIDSPMLSGIEADLSDTKHWLSHRGEPHGNKVESHDFDGMATNRVISHFQPDQKHPVKLEIKEEIVKKEQGFPINEEPTKTATSDTSMQTDSRDTVDVETQMVAESKDECTQYRYRRKTKNFMSQYKVPSKTIGTYFRIKSKDASTQFDPPQLTQAADSTSLPLDDELGSCQPDGNDEKKSRYVHSLQVLRSFQKQRDLGMLCDITLAAQGQHFKSHKSLLASCSEFFYTLFASEAIKQSPLSYIELQGITASALSLVLDYIYTSEVSADGGVKNVTEFIIAARRLKINSLFRVCVVLEEALAAGQDLTGWKISNTELISPDACAETSLGSSGSMVLQPNDEITNRKSSQGGFPGFNETDKFRRSPTEENVAFKESPHSSADDEKPLKRSLSEVREQFISKRRKSRSLSLVDAASAKKMKISEDNERPFLCVYCGKSFTKKKNLSSHVSKMHPRSTRGASPGSVGSSLEADVAHTVEAKNNASDEMKCDECLQTFKTTAKLNAHLRRSHRESTRRQSTSKDKKDVVPPQGRKKNGVTRLSVKEDPAELGTLSLNGTEAVKIEERANKSSKSSDKDSLTNIIQDNFLSGDNTFASSKIVTGNAVDDPTKVKLKLYQCEICEEIFSVQCFYKAHMAGHKRNGEFPV